MQTFRFYPCELPYGTQALRQELRDFLADELTDYPARKRAETWMGWDADFSRKMGERGWIGMTWPKQYGGHERSALERYVVLEEMLSAGAPVAAHWIGDRQSGPLLLNYGTEDQRQKYLPRIASGQCFFCIGMSEPDSGSDLASVRTRAERTDEGWRVTGTKLWTSGAHKSHVMIALFRTSTEEGNRHGGLTQFLVDLDTPGITVRPIKDLSGNAHFNEVIFEDVLVPDSQRVGEVGGGWNQVTAELAYERSGPERYLSCYPLVAELVEELSGRDDVGERAEVEIGRLVAELSTLRHMSVSVAGMLEAGQNPALEASVVKDLGAVLEQRIPGLATELLERPFHLGTGGLDEAAAYLVQNAPSFSLRGGTREILRGIIARGLGLR
ncbi:acyl-CoA dehydrogenase family protein [Pyruvatibacter mobilis]|uniref:acyl-CoA dehydrogenase family protein n=1 Tax=Pyruvatibacter mobilis TaxID=1712261 RepID=UPI003BABA42E